MLTHTRKHTHTYRLTHARYGYVQSLERWWLRRRLLLLLLCVCFICIFNIYIYYIYFLIGLNFFRELTQRFLHAIFWFLFYFYFFALRRAQRVCHRTRASTETEIEQPKEHHGARIRIYFCWMSGWMKRRAYCAFVCVCLCVPTRFF